MMINHRYFLLHTDGSCTAGWPIENRELVDTIPGMTMVSPDQKFLCSGQVAEWQYQGKHSHGFRAIVWRPMDDSAMKFLIVGINDIPAGDINAPVTYAVPKSQRITVKAGDVIGWSFGDEVLAFDIGGAHSVRWLGGNLHGSLQANQEHDFFIAGVQNREYSIAATVIESEPGEKI